MESKEQQPGLLGLCAPRTSNRSKWRGDIEGGMSESSVANDNFQRMLSDLQREYSRISSENANLRMELKRSRVSTMSLDYEDERGLTPGSHVGDDGLYGGSSDPDDSTVRGAMEPTTRRPPVLPCGSRIPWSQDARDMKEAGSTKLKKSVSIRTGSEDCDTWDDRTSQMQVTRTGDEEECASVTEMPVSADWRNVEDGLADPTSTAMDLGGENPVREQLIAQYARILGNEGGGQFLGAKQLHKIVSQFECKQYGHNKHQKNKVAKTMKQINEAYGGPERPTRGPYGVVVCEETFIDFMDPQNDIKGGDDDPEEDFEYLKKALRVEETEYMADEARKDIAKKRETEIDPEPRGYFQVYTLEIFPPIVIGLNALALGLQADIKTDWWFWSALELVFLMFYITEFVAKLKLLGCRRFFRGVDAYWNWFDVLCIIVSIVDLLMWFFMELISDGSDKINLKVLRLARLVRIIKSFRYKFFDDLKVMALGVLSGAKVLVWAVLLFFVCVFVLAVLMREILSDSWGFENMPKAMFTVFRCFTDGCTAHDGTPLHSSLQERYGGLFTIGYILVFLVITFGVFNLIIAVFIDSVSTTTVKRKQRELGRREEEMKIAIEEILVKLVRKIYKKDEDTRWGSGQGSNPKADLLSRALASTAAMAEVRQKRIQISRELFNTWLSDKEFLQVLEEVEIDTATKYEIFDVCDVDKSGSLTCDELVSGLMRLRGPISKCDVIAIRLKVRYLTKMLEDIHHKVRA